MTRGPKRLDVLVTESYWEEYGIVSDVVPFTNNYPQADIHELISLDILHQIIKGTFKDHLVNWVESYLKITHGTSHAAQIMDGIDNKIAAVYSFTGLQRFLEGRGFKQWTVDDSKALMKVYLPAIRGHVPDDVHSLNHYLLLIRQFGAPNGLCSSITESKHIKAVKEPWRHSSQFKVLGQMLLTNQQLDKLAAAHADFQAHGMLKGSCLSEALHKLQKCHYESDEEDDNFANSGATLADWPGFLNVNAPECWSIEGEVSEMVDGPAVEAHVDLAATPCCRCDVHALGDELELPNFQQLIQEFIHDQAHTADPNPHVFDPASAPLLLGKVLIFNSAAASFYAPSDLSGTGDLRLHNRLHFTFSAHSLPKLPMTPPCKLFSHALPSPSNSRAKKIWPTQDSPNNPFLSGNDEANASSCESSDDGWPVGEAPRCESTPTLAPECEEKPTITYVCRGQKVTFHNPQYQLPVDVLKASKLPINHPDFEVAEACPPHRLFSNKLKRESCDFDEDIPPINSLGAKHAKIDAGASEGEKSTTDTSSCKNIVFHARQVHEHGERDIIWRVIGPVHHL
ncbi:uncharacterized protein EDB93DRAFT_1249619 [Suillus bovinus]|uniref:uncharacterized protein n=1 Tax=Suillus bovinus TaxID=48563 RepID=UPI001B8706F9|nr:uncharacterized protein EDB93DRAFT_1249619 [Suillus bovinus]KAG2151129.1 hypothetical protein EDB93DRAFT_1249619 [Suillus bovinus]